MEIALKYKASPSLRRGGGFCEVKLGGVVKKTIPHPLRGIGPRRCCASPHKGAFFPYASPVQGEVVRQSRAGGVVSDLQSPSFCIRKHAPGDAARLPTRGPFSLKLPSAEVAAQLPTRGTFFLTPPLWRTCAASPGVVPR